MLRRDVRHSLRRLSMTLSGLLVPIIMLVLFVYVFGGAIGSGLGGVAHGGAYIDYIASGIIIMTVGSGGATTAINLCMDMSEGIIARFRTMAIARASVLTGQVIGSLIRTLISVALVVGVALLMGFRPTTNLVAWVAALGIIALFALAVTWMGVVFGLVGKTPAGANSLSLCWLLGTSVRRKRQILRTDVSSSQHSPVYPINAIAISSPKRTPRPSVSAAGL